MEKSILTHLTEELYTCKLSNMKYDSVTFGFLRIEEIRGLPVKFLYGCKTYVIEV